MSPARLHHRQNCRIRSVDKLGLERVHPQRATVTARTTVIQKRYEALERTDQGLQIGTRLAEARQRYLSARDGLLAARGDDEQVRLRADAFQALTRDYIVAADAMVAWQLERQKALGAEVERRIEQAHQKAREAPSFRAGRQSAGSRSEPLAGWSSFLWHG